MGDGMKAGYISLLLAILLIVPVNNPNENRVGAYDWYGNDVYFENATFTPIDTDGDGYNDSLKCDFVIHSNVTGTVDVGISLEDYANNTVGLKGDNSTTVYVELGENNCTLVGTVNGFLPYMKGNQIYAEPTYFRVYYFISNANSKGRTGWFYLYPYHYGYDVLWFQSGYGSLETPKVISIDLDGDGKPDSLQLNYSVASNKYDVFYTVKMYLKKYSTNETIDYAETNGVSSLYLQWSQRHYLNVSLPPNYQKGLYKAYVELINQYGEVQQAFLTQYPSNEDWYYLFPCTNENEILTANANGPYSGYVGNAIQFYGSASGGVPPYSWHWNFGDGSTSSQQNPTHVYTSEGTYTVTLTVTDSDGNTSIDTTTAEVTTMSQYTLTVQISPNNAGYVTLNPSGGVYDYGTTVIATAHAYSGYIFDHWSGDASGTNTTIQIIMNGNKTIVANFIQNQTLNTTVYIEDASAMQNEEATTPIIIDTSEAMGVGSATIKLYYDPSVVIVTSVSDGDLGSVTYNIDNGVVTMAAAVATSPGPTGIVYFANITLKAVGNVGDTSALHLEVISLYDATPGSPQPIDYTTQDGTFTVTGSIELTANADGSGYVGNAIQFYGSASGGVPPYSYHWDFGDGSVATEQNPTHVYTTEGTYTVTLTVTDSDGNTSIDTTTAEVTTMPQYTLTVQISPNNAGYVTLNPSGGIYDYGTTVTATAHAYSGYIFDHWSGDVSDSDEIIQITMDGNKTIVANFIQNRYTFVNVTPCHHRVSVNETFIVNITIEPSVGIAGVQCDILFNASLLEVISIEEGNLFDGYDTFFNASIDNLNGTINDIYDAIIAPGGSVSHAGTFVKITFKAKKEGASYINITNAAVGDVNAQPVAIKINNGSVEIVTHPWDVNDDGVVDIFDLIIVGQHFGSHEGEESYMPEADVNKDGTIDILDLIIIGQHFGGN